MGGFLRTSLNIEFSQGIFDIIIERLLYCSQLMKNDCIDQGIKIDNNEEKIRNYLLENYLDNDEIKMESGVVGIGLRFIPEAQENYIETNNTYLGRTDIKVVSKDWFSCKKDYYIIECKRIDGSNDLNKKYINNGICRFVVPPIKYTSYHMRNVMFGFIVKNMDIPKNTICINELQRDIIKDFINEELLLERESNEYFLYKSVYNLEETSLELEHIFYNFTEAIN